MVRDDGLERRKLLRTVGSLTVGTVALTGSAVASELNVNTDFNPDDPEEVRRFIESYHEELSQLNSEEEKSEFKKEVRSELSDQQSEAVAEYFTKNGSMSVGVEKKRISENDVNILNNDGFYDFSYTVSAAIILVGKEFDAFEYTHKLEWEVKDGDVVDCTSRQGGYDTKSHLVLFWSFESARVRSKDVEDTHCEATRFAKFSRNVISGNISSGTDTTTITLLGDDTGSGSAPRVQINGEDINQRR